MSDGAQTATRGRRRMIGADSGRSQQYDHEVLEISRVVRVVKGGRRFRFRATVVIGDKAGTVGIGVAKSRDVQQAIKKAQDQAEKHAVKVTITEGTIPHQVMHKYKGAKILLKPAKPGTGLIAGGTVRMVADMAGITDLVAKRYGSPSRLSNARATIAALSSMRS